MAFPNAILAFPHPEPVEGRIGGIAATPLLSAFLLSRRGRSRLPEQPLPPAGDRATRDA
jgi:hypothetical protein